MGSFANSVHVRSDDAESVAATIRELLLAAKYEPSQKTLSESHLCGMSDKRRAVQVSNSSSGWIGVLDSDFTSATGLATEISLRLETFAISVFVIDSDSWLYNFFDRGQLRDGFDSARENAGSAAMHSPLQVLNQFPQLSPEVLNQLQIALSGHMGSLRSYYSSVMPQSICDIWDKIAGRKATNAEMSELFAWIRTDPLTLFDSPSTEATDPTTGYNALRPILLPSTSEELLQSVLQKNAVFAEDILAEFLSLLGINREFANLSYRCASESSPEELRRHGIDLEHHLMFERGKAKKKTKKKQT